MLLVEFARAGTNELKSYFKKDLEKIRERHLNIRERITHTQDISRENQIIYYSSWLYGAVHIAATISTYKTVSKISTALCIEEGVVRDIILFLLSSGLLIEKDGELYPGPTQLHLGKESPYIRQHHSNWRIAATQALSTKKESGIHYSTVSSLSHADAEKLKSKFVQMIQDYVEIVGPSKEETLFNFNLDFYSLIKK